MKLRPDKIGEQFDPCKQVKENVAFYFFFRKYQQSSSTEDFQLPRLNK